MNTNTIFSTKLSTIFIAGCGSLFIYKASECVYSFVTQEPLARSTVERQELHPLPSICISPSKLPGEIFSSRNLTLNEYQKEGKWRSEFSSTEEEAIYNELSASFEDLVEKITLHKGVNEASDSYEQLILHTETEGLILERCDYYYNLKCFCVQFREDIASKVIQRIKLHLKMDSVIAVTPPGNYFALERKQSEIFIASGFRYRVGFWEMSETIKFPNVSFLLFCHLD